MAKSTDEQIRFLTSALAALSDEPRGFRTSDSTSLSTPELDSSITTRAVSPSVATPTPDLEHQSSPGSIWYAVTNTHDKGISLAAARRIPAGTLIFSEPPLLRLAAVDETSMTAIDDAFASLSKSDRKAYSRLFNAKKGHTSDASGIYNSNCYDIKAFSYVGGSCIGATSSRLNHSCIPNVAFSYIPPEQVSLALLSSMTPAEEEAVQKKGLIQFRAIKNISNGKELLSNYEKNIFAPRATRKDRLKRHYGFGCDCEACEPVSDFWEKSDQRRKAMEGCIKEGARLERQWLKVDDNKEHEVQDEKQQRREILEEAIAKLLELESLLLKEGLTYTPLANCHKSLAKWSARDNDREAEVAWIEKELEVVTRCFGHDSARAIALRASMGKRE